MSVQLLDGSSLTLPKCVLENLPDAIVVLDHNGQLVSCNRCARETVPADALEALVESTRPVAIRALFEQLASGGGPAHVEWACKRANGRTERLRFEGFSADRWFVIRIHEVVDQAELQIELAQLRRYAALGARAATIIHDFNNLLTPILGWTRLLEEQLDQTSPEASLAADIESVAARAALLLQDAQTLAQTKRSESRGVAANEAVLSMRAPIERLFPPSVTVEFALAPEVGAVRVNLGGLEHALLNLLVNARNAMPGPGCVTIRTQVASRGLPSSSGTRMVSLSVSDTGTGMTEEVRARAFDEFFTTRASAGGTGIGLCSVKRFALESGGGVDLASAPGAGTTVTLFLPCDDAPADGED
jgi:signal transduction histidine kinase